MAQTGNGQSDLVPFLHVTNFERCQGSYESVDITALIAQRTGLCGGGPEGQVNLEVLVQSSENCAKQSINNLQRLANQNKNGLALNIIWLFFAQSLQFVQGQVETLWLVTSGPLQGRYVYRKLIYEHRASYLKKCSSLLGRNYITSRVHQILISDELDINVLIANNNQYEIFKRTASTVCDGQMIQV